MKDWSESAFLAHFVQNAPQVMWFLGAGTSRTAGMPTASDIIWDLKRQYYCLQENQDLQSHDISNQAIKRKIQEYLDSKGFPPSEPRRSIRSFSILHSAPTTVLSSST